MIDHYTIFSLATGRVLRSGFAASSQIADPATEGELIGQLVDDDSHYIDPADGVTILARPSSPITANNLAFVADGVDELQFSNVPTGSVAVVTPFPEGDALSDTVDDGTYVFTTTIPGKYTVQLLCFPEQDVSFEVEATA